jgi:hypothetical protein
VGSFSEEVRSRNTKPPHLCLIKLNRGAEAIKEAEQYFADFPDDRESSLGEGIIKRIERIKAELKSVSS